MKHTQTSLPNFETAVFGRKSLKDAISKLEKYPNIKTELNLLKETFNKIAHFLSVLDVNKNTAVLLANFISTYRNSSRGRYTLSYSGFNSWLKRQDEKEIKLMKRFKQEINGLFAGYTLLQKMQREVK